MDDAQAPANDGVVRERARENKREGWGGGVIAFMLAPCSACATRHARAHTHTHAHIHVQSHAECFQVDAELRVKGVKVGCVPFRVEKGDRASEQAHAHAHAHATHTHTRTRTRKRWDGEGCRGVR